MRTLAPLTVLLTALLAPELFSAETLWSLDVKDRNDAISLVARTATIEAIDVELARGVFRGEGDAPCRLLRVGYAGGILAEEGKISVVSKEGRTARRLGPKGDCHQAEILVPVARFDAPLEVAVSLQYRGKTFEKAVSIPSERPWEVHLVHQTHLDIGYTHTQEDVLARQVQSLKEAIQYIDQTRDYPDAARFRFHPEGMWAVDEFMRTASDAEQEALVRAARARDIHLDGMYAQAMTGMYNDEELFELMAGAARFGKAHRVTVDSAMQTDVPGYTWGLVSALAANGIRYMTMGPNGGHRVGRVYYWADRPFWWESPSGKQRVLCWLSGSGYALWHRSQLGQRIEEDQVFQALDQLATKDYPFNLVMLRYNIEGDNGRPNRAISDSVKDWNQKYIWPKLVVSRNSDVMRELERRHGGELPVVRGDYTPYWEDGCASTSEATSLCREGCERVIQAQALYAMLQPGAFPAEAFEGVWTDLIMYDEHTWGAYCSISRPDDPFTIHQDQYKQAYARRGRQAADDLVERAVNQPGGAEPAAAIDVFNTASWERGGVVSIDLVRGAGKISVHDADRRAVNTQVLSDGKLAFRTGEAPAFGGRRFTLGHDTPKSEGTAYADAEKLAIGNGLVDLRIDPESGAIASLRCKGIAAELVKSGDDGNRGLNDYLYILGRNAEENRSRQSGSVVVTAVDRGPLLARLRIESPAPNCRTLVREITVVDGCEEIAIENRMEKLMERKPEGTFFGFPLNVPGGQWRINVPWAVVRPELDQLPGANRNYYCVERWCDLSNDQFGVTWVTLDANMMQFAPILYTPVSDIRAWREEIAPGGTLYSWVCNNHWETNYKAGQEGPLKFRYVLRPHAGPYDQAEVQRSARGVHQPLLAFSSRADRPLPEPVLELDNSAVVATCLKPARDAQGLIVRLFNTTGEKQQVALQTRKDATSIWLSNPLEEKLSAASTRLALEKYEIVTLRIE